MAYAPNNPLIDLSTSNRRTVALIQKHIVKRGKRVIFYKHFGSKDDESLIATWRLDLDMIRGVFDVRSLTLSDDR